MPGRSFRSGVAVLLLLGNFPVLGVVAAQVVTVSPSRPGVHHVEPLVASSPNDSTRLVVAAMQVESTALATWRVRTWWSANGGRTWNAAALPARDGVECAADPWVTWGRALTVYLVCLAPVPVAGGNDFHFEAYLYRSRNGGQSWLPPLPVPVDTTGEWDHPVIVQSPSRGAREEEVFWIAGTRSTRRSGSGSGIISYHAGSERFGPFRMYVPPVAGNHVFAAAVATGPERVTLTYFTMNSEPPRPYYAVRGGPAAFESSLLRPSVTPWGFPMMTLLHAAPAGPAIGAVWLEGSQAEGLDVWFARSEDEGRTWPLPVRVMEGRPVFRTRPNVAADQTGVIAVTWFESASGGPCGQVRVRFSRDRGRTFGGDREFPRSTTPCPADGPLRQIAERWRGGGDYSGIASPLPGMFDLVWADIRDDGHQVRFTRIRLAP